MIRKLPQTKITQVILKHKLSEVTKSWTALFDCSVLNYSQIPLKLYREDTYVKEKHQTSDPEKNVVRMYEFVKYLVQLFGVALFWDASNTVYRINSCKHNLKRSSDQFRENTESNDHWINSVKQQNHMIIGWIPWQHRIKWWSDQFRGNTQSDDHQINFVERQN